MSTKGGWLEWILFFLEAVRRQSEDSRQRVGRIRELHARYRELAIAKYDSKAMIPAVEYMMEHVYVSVPAIAEHTHSSSPTARAVIDALVNLNILSRYDRIRGAQVWVADELLHEIYET